MTRAARAGRAALLFCFPVLLPVATRAQTPVPTGAESVEAVAADLATLRANLATLLEDPALTRSHVGLVVVSAGSGEVLFERNGERRFMAASTSKLVTGAVALARLGSAYRWETTVRAGGPIEAARLDGDLWVVGGGDPLLDGAALERMARSVRAAGIARITGDLVGDDRRFAGAPWGRGWMWDDLYGSFAAGVSALTVSPSRIAAELLPGASPGDSTVLRWPEALAAPTVRNEVRTGAPGSEIRLEYVPDAIGGTVALRGWIPSDIGRMPLGFAPFHPTAWFLERFRRALAEAGVEIEGAARTARRDEPLPDASWERHFRSPPLESALGRMLKSSDNQIAELLLRSLGALDGDGSAEAGLDVVRRTLAGWGIDPGAFSLADGSGMSRYNEISPAALVRLLRRASQLREFAVFRDALPVASVDGTLARRFLDTAATRSVRAKTGSLSGVRALAGYVEDGDGETLVFALLLNGYDAPAAVATAMQDLLVEQLALYHGPTYPRGRTSGHP